MDQFMVDVTGIVDAAEDDEVTLIGRDGDGFISVEELAGTGGGFHYEIICGIGKRVPRVYIRDGRVIGKKDYFNDIWNNLKKIEEKYLDKIFNHNDYFITDDESELFYEQGIYLENIEWTDDDINDIPPIKIYYVTIRFWIISLLCSLIGLIILKLR